MTTDIQIVTFIRDLDYTRFCLLSIQKFARGFGQVHLVVPTTDLKAFERLANDHPGPVPIRVKGFEQVPEKGMLHHMVMVCKADLLSTADYILHMDADCIFHEPVSPEDYFVGGKPVLLRELFTRMDGPVLQWQIAVEKALGWKPAHETMRRHPAVHPRWLYPAVRATIEAYHKCDFEQYVLSCHNAYPQTFAEFPTLGAWAIRYAPWAYHWVEVGMDPIPPKKLTQFWTHGGVDMVWEKGPFTVRQLVERALA